MTDFLRVSKNLYYADLAKENESLLDAVMKATEDKQGSQRGSSQGVSTGRKGHPFNFDMVGRFQTVNVHHGRSIHAKVSATVGLGFQTPNDRERKKAKQDPMGEVHAEKDLQPENDVARIDQILDPICEHSWQDTINDVCEDYWQTGNGYLEVVRGSSGEVLGLYHIPAKEVFVVVEDHRYNRHYSIQGGEDSTGSRLFAKYGDLDGFLERVGKTPGVVFDATAADVNKDTVSEVIHFRRPTSLSRWYGFPDWLAAVAAIELVQCVTQHEYDFFLNRGVPEFILFLFGQNLSPKDKAKIETAMRATMGLGNQHKSLLINLANPEIKAQLEKLAMESKSDASQFSSLSESLALNIVSAHGVPPLLAGIQIPGKLGASNEMIQAMQAFQVLVIEPAQRLFRQTLMNTLGREKGLGLKAEDFVLRTITDSIDVQKSDTMARMRQSPQQAQAEGRDLDKGVKKEEWTDEERGELVVQGINALIDRIVGRAA